MLVVLEATLTLEVLGDLGQDERIGNRDLGVGQQMLQHLVTGLEPLLKLLGALSLRLDVGRELIHGVELGGQLGELVVKLGQDTLLDRLDRHRDIGVLALLIASGERRRERLDLFGGHPDECVVQSVDHVAGTDLVGDPLGRVDLLLVDRRRKVDRHEVTHGGDPLDASQSAKALT